MRPKDLAPPRENLQCGMDAYLERILKDYTSSCRPERSVLCGVKDLISLSSGTLGCTEMAEYYVYILSNTSRMLYTGVTNHLVRRVLEHKSKRIPGYTQQYNITWLVYFEATSDIRSAIEREKQIKGWVRARKMALIESLNPKWEDLSRDWFDEETISSAKLSSEHGEGSGRQ